MFCCLIYSRLWFTCVCLLACSALVFFCWNSECLHCCCFPVKSAVLSSSRKFKLLICLIPLRPPLLIYYGWPRLRSRCSLALLLRHDLVDYHQGFSVARSNDFLLPGNSGNYSVYKLLMILCSASWTWTLHMHWLVLSKNIQAPHVCFWSFFSLHYPPFWNLLCKLSTVPYRLLYPQLSKTSSLFLGSFRCPWPKYCNQAENWSDHMLILSDSFLSRFSVFFCLLYNTWNKSIHIFCSVIWYLPQKSKFGPCYCIRCEGRSLAILSFESKL